MVFFLDKTGRLENDVALVKLRVPVSLSSYVNPICLASSDTIIPTGSNCIVAGWGRDGEHFMFIYFHTTVTIHNRHVSFIKHLSSPNRHIPFINHTHIFMHYSAAILNFGRHIFFGDVNRSYYFQCVLVYMCAKCHAFITI